MKERIRQLEFDLAGPNAGYGVQSTGNFGAPKILNINQQQTTAEMAEDDFWNQGGPVEMNKPSGMALDESLNARTSPAAGAIMVDGARGYY